jgi:phosphoribosyl 1,2-cyclic phosphodiesterase
MPQTVKANSRSQISQSNAFAIQFWGVRGTIPVPGGATIRYGGNTPCVSLRLDEEHILILDAGTGIRPLGRLLAKEDAQIFLLISHKHWDHIQGFPSFLPIYQPRRRIHLLPALDETMARALLTQMDGVHFPVRGADLSSLRLVSWEEGVAALARLGLHIQRIPVNHPGGAFGYRMTRGGKTVIYLTDNELDAPPETHVTGFDAFVDFCREADVLIHDAQYLPQDMPAKRGWGHSILPRALELAAAARVGHLILFHHDPDRSDDDLDGIQADARAWLARHAAGVRCTVAYEGLELTP